MCQAPITRRHSAGALDAMDDVIKPVSSQKKPKRDENSENLPTMVLIALTLTFASVSIDETVLFPFVPSQVASFGVTATESELGYYAGLIGSAYYVGTLVSSSGWGLLSDRIGRKPVLVMGIMSNVLWSTVYGFSGNLWQAVLFRFCNGFFGGLYPVGKTTVAEMSKSGSQEGVYYVVGLGWALGFLFGPAIGGFFSEPSMKYPALFPEESFFDRYPFALPCIIVAIIAVINLIFVYRYVPETLGRAKIDPENLESEMQRTKNECDVTAATNATSYATVDVWKLETGTPGEVTAGSKGSKVEDRTTSGADLLEGKGEGGELGEGDPGWFRAFFFERETVILSVMYAIMGFTVTSYTEVFALWGLTDWDLGGLGFNTTTVGLIQAAAGPLLIPYQLYLYAPFANSIGPLTTLRVALLAMTVLALYPVCRLFTGYYARATAAGIFMASRGISVTTSYTTYLILIANSVRFPKYLGSVNGISQAVQMLLMACAPAAGSSIYAWSITGIHGFPLDFHLYWILLGVLCLLMLSMSYLLPSSINRRKFTIDQKE